MYTNPEVISTGVDLGFERGGEGGGQAKTEAEIQTLMIFMTYLINVPSNTKADVVEKVVSRRALAI